MDEALSPLADPWRREPGGWHYEVRVARDHAASALATFRAERNRLYPEADLSADVLTVVKVWTD